MPAFGPASAISGSHRICEICQGKRRDSGIGKNIGAHRADGRRLAVDHAPNPFGQRNMLTSVRRNDATARRSACRLNSNGPATWMVSRRAGRRCCSMLSKIRGIRPFL